MHNVSIMILMKIKGGEHMNFALTNGESYFCGWDILGNMKFTTEKRLAYRMFKSVAEITLEKVNGVYGGYKVITL